MRKLRDFNCPKCGTIEEFAKDEVKEINCKCGSKAIRLVSGARYFGNTTGRSPSAASR